MTPAVQRKQERPFELINRSPGRGLESPEELKAIRQDHRVSIGHVAAVLGATACHGNLIALLQVRSIPASVQKPLGLPISKPPTTMLPARLFELRLRESCSSET